MQDNLFQLTFYGVRGSCPVPGKETITYGGNTPCLHLSIEGKDLILDAGTGISALGSILKKKGIKKAADIHLFLSHFHWDHIQGFPFFEPAYFPANIINIYGYKGIADVMQHQMSNPFFPVNLKEMKAEINFIELEKLDCIKLNNISIFTYPGNHSRESLIYRIEYRGRSCCYLTDHEHFTGNLKDRNKEISDFIQETDLLIYDAHFTEEEYRGLNGEIPKKTWGHSTWQEGIQLAIGAGVKKLCLFHHAPFRKDEDIRKIETEARQLFENTTAAREGMVISL